MSLQVIEIHSFVDDTQTSFTSFNCGGVWGHGLVVVKDVSRYGDRWGGQDGDWHWCWDSRTDGFGSQQQVGGLRVGAETPNQHQHVSNILSVVDEQTLFTGKRLHIVTRYISLTLPCDFCLCVFTWVWWSGRWWERWGRRISTPGVAPSAWVTLTPRGFAQSWRQVMSAAVFIPADTCDPSYSITWWTEPVSVYLTPPREALYGSRDLVFQLLGCLNCLHRGKCTCFIICGLYQDRFIISVRLYSCENSSQ